MTASRWPMRWQRSSAWSCIAGRPLELEEGDVRGARERDALRGRRGSRRRSAAGPSGSWKARDRPPRARRCVSRAEQVQRVAGSARAPPPGPRRGGRTRRAARRRRGSRGSRPARRASLPRAARRWSVPSCARRSARSVAAIFASSSREVERLLAQPGDHVAARRAGTRARCRARPGRRPGAWPGSCGSTSRLQAAHEAAAAQVPVQALLGQRPLELAREARARAEVLQAADDAQLRDQLLGVVEHRRAGQREPQPVRRDARSASRRTAWVRLALRVLDSSATRRRRARAGAAARASSRCAATIS